MPRISSELSGFFAFMERNSLMLSSLIGARQLFVESAFFHRDDATKLVRAFTQISCVLYVFVKRSGIELNVKVAMRRDSKGDRS